MASVQLMLSTLVNFSNGNPTKSCSTSFLGRQSCPKLIVYVYVLLHPANARGNPFCLWQPPKWTFLVSDLCPRQLHFDHFLSSLLVHICKCWHHLLQACESANKTHFAGNMLIHVFFSIFALLTVKVFCNLHFVSCEISSNLRFIPKWRNFWQDSQENTNTKHIVAYLIKISCAHWEGPVWETWSNWKFWVKSSVIVKYLMRPLSLFNCGK